MKIKMTLLEKMLFTLNMGFRVAKAEEEKGDGEKSQSGQPTGEGDPTNNSNPTQQTKQQASVDFESLIAKARAEEKEKLYPEINKLKADLEKKVSRINELLLTIGEKDEVIAQKEKELKDTKSSSKKSESQEVKDLKVQITNLENQLSEKDSEISNIKLDSYKQKKIAEAGGDLIPELVTGTSEEEIDLAIEKSVERYKEIVGKLQPQQKQQDSNNIPPANPATNAFDNNQVNLGDLQNINLMTPEGRAQYQKLREQMNIR